MQVKKRGLFIGILLVLVVVIKWYSTSSHRVETGYATGIYPAFAQFLRLLFGWLPFSIGDVLYGLFGLWLLYKIIKGLRLLLQKKATLKGTGIRTGKILVLLLVLYTVFNSFWGINYNRKGIYTQLGLKKDTVSYDELKQITTLLIDKMNTTKQYLIDNKKIYPNNKTLFKNTQAAYQNVQKQYPFLGYKNISLKSSLWGWMGNYTGFTGYYNPFTGEAQVNTTVPKFLQPFVACHEVAHQLGYAKENEANSVAFVTALHSNDSMLLYSTYFDMYTYASRQLFLQAFIKRDTALITTYQQSISPAVKADFKEMMDFFYNHRSPVEPFIRDGYNLFLKSNNQPLGIKTYDAVTSFIVAYYKKFGKI